MDAAGDPLFSKPLAELKALPEEKRVALELVGQRSFVANERLIAHNLAILRAGQNEYVMAGGMGPILGHRRRRGDEGIRFTRGTGWPWSSTRWTWPEVAINETDPAGCAERRLARIPLGQGVLDTPLCDFDGRLSVVLFKGTYHLFARANLLEKAVTGGRYVQSTTSADGLKTWSRWQTLFIQSIPPGFVDFYFWHVQLNPVRDSSLLAIFPVSQPPHACIGISFSKNGIDFSRPINLQQRRASLGWRTVQADGRGKCRAGA